MEAMLGRVAACVAPVLLGLTVTMRILWARNEKQGENSFSYMELLAGICMLVAIIQGGGELSFVRLESHGLKVRIVMILTYYNDCFNESDRDDINQTLA